MSAMIAILADNFIPEKGEKVLVSDRSDNNGRTWYYFAYKQENQEENLPAKSTSYQAGSRISRFCGSYIVTRVYKRKVVIKPV